MFAAAWQCPLTDSRNQRNPASQHFSLAFQAAWRKIRPVGESSK